MTETQAAPFTVLVVCTGNICRSPIAERLLRSQCEKLGLPVLVHSAGTLSMVGQAMTPEAAGIARHYRADPADHRSRQLTERLIVEADLILTASRQHRSKVVSLHPRAARYSYTINQFARLLPAALESLGTPTNLAASPGDPGTAQAEPGRLLRALVAEVAATRGFSPPPLHPDADDIEDPYRQSTAVYARVGAVLDTAVSHIARGFATVTRR